MYSASRIFHDGSTISRYQNPANALFRKKTIPAEACHVSLPQRLEKMYDCRNTCRPIVVLGNSMAFTPRIEGVYIAPPDVGGEVHETMVKQHAKQLVQTN